MCERWVERLRYSGFSSEEEARRFLDEQLKMFSHMEEEMRRFHEEMMRFMESTFRLFQFAPPTPTRKPTLEELIQRIEKLERELKETKEEIVKTYAKAKVEIR